MGIIFMDTMKFLQDELQREDDGTIPRGLCRLMQKHAGSRPDVGTTVQGLKSAPQPPGPRYL